MGRREALYSATVIRTAAHGEYETDLSDVFYIRIDKNRKLPSDVYRALGLSSDTQITRCSARTRVVATLEKDTAKDTNEALIEICSVAPGRAAHNRRRGNTASQSLFRRAQMICQRRQV